MTARTGTARRYLWLNFEGGGRTPAGEFDFSRLQRLVAPLNEPRRPEAMAPIAVFALCEAKEWVRKATTGC